MKWNYKIGRLAGIDIYVNITFPLLLFVILTTRLQEEEARMADALLSVAGVIVVFGIVVLHELGHALAARRFGIPTRDIILLPIGGVARLERMPSNPWQELVVAIAGPMVNVALALVGVVALYSLAYLTGDESPLTTAALYFVGVNVALAVFNLLPAFPMDGGRVLRALLALRLNYVRATEIASLVGKLMAVLFFVAGWYLNPFLMLIAVFVWFGAGQEAAVIRMRAALHGVPVREIMIRRFYTLAPHDRIGYAMRMLLGNFQDEFPVVDEGRLRGLMRGDAIREAMGQGDEWARVDVFMDAEVHTVGPNEHLDEVLMKMAEWTQQSVPVVENGYLVGLVTRANLQRYIALRNAHIASGRPPQRGAPSWEAPSNLYEPPPPPR